MQEAQCEQIAANVDRVDQYNRQYILNFLHILNRGTKACPERPYDVIIEFFCRPATDKIFPVKGKNLGKTMLHLFTANL